LARQALSPIGGLSLEAIRGNGKEAVTQALISATRARARPLGSQEWIRLLLAGGALFSGAALLAHILTGVPLRAVLIGFGCVVVVAGRVIWRRTPPILRPMLARVIRVGAGAGCVATVAYDSSKALLSRLDPTPYDPFEAIRVFGVLLSGSSSPAAAYPVGALYHLLNGVAFGVGFCLLLGRRGILAGMAWGLGLECFQLWLYPGWLHIKLYREFAQFSMLGHLVYGSVLGLLCRRALSRPVGSASPRVGQAPG